MKLSEFLDDDAYAEVSIFRITAQRDDLRGCEVEPVSTPTLSSQGDEDIPDGYFVLKARHIPASGAPRDCYIDMTLPERIAETACLKEGRLIVEKGVYELSGSCVPYVAIESFGNYELYYSKEDPEFGIDVLRRGGRLARNKAPIVQDLAYILRDEGRYTEAVEAFTLLIELGPPNYFAYVERARALEALGDTQGAESDWRKVESLAGPVAVKSYRD